jgi:hypothetical protein
MLPVAWLYVHMKKSFHLLLLVFYQGLLAQVVPFSPKEQTAWFIILLLPHISSVAVVS